jgi:hypothetical protein
MAPKKRARNARHDTKADGRIALPCWDKMMRELWLGDTLVKRFNVPAGSQTLILDSFHDEGWPHGIDDPLPWSRCGDMKARLRAAIWHLNHCQINSLIRFHANGTGDGIHWQPQARALPGGPGSYGFDR